MKESLFNLFSLLSCLCRSGDAPCWPVVSDDVKYKVLPLMHIHCLLEDLVSQQLPISVTQMQGQLVFAEVGGQWLLWLWLHKSFCSMPLLYNSPFFPNSWLLEWFFSFLFFPLPSSLTAARSGFCFWKVWARAVCLFWNTRILLIMKILGVLSSNTWKQKVKMFWKTCLGVTEEGLVSIIVDYVCWKS